MTRLLISLAAVAMLAACSSNAPGTDGQPMPARSSDASRGTATSPVTSTGPNQEPTNYPTSPSVPPTGGSNAR